MLEDQIVFATLPAADPGRARRFYEEKLGLVPVMETDEGNFYRCRDSWFVVFPTEYAGTAQNTGAGWWVDDLEAEMAELRGRGVIFEEYDLPDFTTVDGIFEMDVARTAWFKDSEGNTIMLAQLKRTPW